MKKNILLLLAGLSIGAAFSQTRDTATFENLLKDSGTVANGQGGYNHHAIQMLGSNDSLILPTEYDTSFGGFWASGWAISSKQDSSRGTSNFLTQLYCNAAAAGANGSKVFAIGQNNTWMKFTGNYAGIASFMINNTTYAYNSMKNGDLYAKKFGGKSGNDPDFLSVKIKKYLQGNLWDSVTVYLADYRFASHDSDYILSRWKNVSFAAPYPDSISFEMNGSDTGSFGLNTPAFFAVDNVVVTTRASIRNYHTLKTEIWPVPSSGTLHISAAEPLASVQIQNLQGASIRSAEVAGNHIQLGLAGISSGVYLLQCRSVSGAVSTSKLLVQQ